MILGIGNDLARISRLGQAVERFGTPFLEKIFTDSELYEYRARNGSAAYLAGRWAAKEATAKALGCGFGRNCGWREIETISGANRRPELALRGRAAKFAAAIGVERTHVSISHDGGLALATVVLES